MGNILVLLKLNVTIHPSYSISISSIVESDFLVVSIQRNCLRRLTFDRITRNRFRRFRYLSVESFSCNRLILSNFISSSLLIVVNRIAHIVICSPATCQLNVLCRHLKFAVADLGIGSSPALKDIASLSRNILYFDFRPTNIFLRGSIRLTVNLISHRIRRHRHLRRCIQQCASFLTVLRIASQASLISFDIIRVVIMFVCQPSGISIIHLNRNRNNQLMARVDFTGFRNDIVFRCVVEARYSNCLSGNILRDFGGNILRIFPSVSVRTFPSYCRCLNSNVVHIAVQYKLLRQRIPQNCTLICRHMSSRDGVGNRLEHVVQLVCACCREIVITTLCSCSKVPVPFLTTENPCVRRSQSCVRIVGRHCLHVLIFVRGLLFCYICLWICTAKNSDSIDFYSLILKSF